MAQIEILVLPSWVLAIPATIGALAVTLLQTKKGDNPSRIAGKILAGFGIGYFLGQVISIKTGFDKVASSFVGAGLSPVIMEYGVAWVKGKFPSSEVKSEEDGKPTNPNP